MSIRGSRSRSSIALIVWSCLVVPAVALAQSQPPVAYAGGDWTILPGEFALRHGASSFDAEEAALYRDWTSGDGRTGSGATTTHEYANSGIYSAALVVADDRGSDDSDSIQTTVLPRFVTEPATDSGRYSSAGFHDPDDSDYTAIVGGTRSFFVFDLTSLTDPRPIASATLVLDAGTVSGGAFGGITYTLYDVSTPIAMLVAGGDGLTAVYDDLGTGVAFSAATEIESGASGIEISIPLLLAGVAAANGAKGGVLAIGGGPSGLGGNFAFSGTGVSGARLEIDFGEVAVPGLSPGAFALLAFLLGSTGLVMGRLRCARDR